MAQATSSGTVMPDDSLRPGECRWYGKLVVRAFSDGLIEAPETVTLTIAPTTTYAPSVFDEVTATILSKNK